MKRGLIDEIRLILCGLCFALTLWIAPKNHPEGKTIIEAIGNWADLSIKERSEK